MGAIVNLFAGTPSDTDSFWYNPVGAPVHSGMDVTPDTALRVSAVFACVRVLAETVASLPLPVFRRLSDDGKEKARDHPLYKVLHDQPNPWQTSLEYREMQMGHLALRGNSYSRIVPGPGGAVGALIPYHPDRMQVERVANGDLRYTYRPENGPQQVFGQEQVHHIRGLSSDGIVGMSPIAVAAESVGVAMATDRHAALVFKHAARPSGVLEIEGTLKAEAEQKLRESWQGAYAGGSAHRVAILPYGMKWHQLGMTSEDAQFLENRKFQVNDIARIFRIPPHMIGDLERATFSNIEHQAIEFVVHTIRPWLVRWEQAITRDLISEPDYFAEFQVDGLLRGDIKSRFEAYKTGVTNGWLSRNEVRAFENMNPVEGLDEFLVPLNMGSASDEEEAESEAPAEPPEPEEEEEESTASAGVSDTWLEALAADAGERIAHAELQKLGRRAMKAAEDPERFKRWLGKFYEGHAAYIEQVLQPLAEAWENGTGRSVSAEETAREMAGLSERRLRGDGEYTVLEIIEEWETGLALRHGRTILEVFRNGSTQSDTCR